MTNEFKIDLHTHSSISFDGGISAAQYAKLLNENPNLYIAITDHNDVSLAIELQNKHGDRIIVGEEILTLDGEIIGLYLTDKISAGLTAQETIQKIQDHGGLVYIPHPLEKTRKGLSIETLLEISDAIDIIETFNARSKEGWLRAQIQKFADEHGLVSASSSDAHGVNGTGTAYSVLSSTPTKENLVELLKQGTLVTKTPPILSFLDPLRNKIKRIFS